jgi:hypothetical protein
MPRLPSIRAGLLGLTLVGCATSAVDPWSGGAEAGAGLGGGAQSTADDAALDAASMGASEDAGDPRDAGGSSGDTGTPSQDAGEGAPGAGAVADAGPAPVDGGGPDASTCGADQDGDGLSDCEEQNDGDPWTDPAIFNGAWVRLADQCSALGACTENDTRAEVEACMQRPLREELAQHAGWDWNDAPDDVCAAAYGFAPNFSVCANTWQAQWRASVQLAAGAHCFEIAGSAAEGCAALYFDAESAPVQTGQGALCYERAAGAYPLLWHYTMDNGSASALHLRYCAAASGARCTPSAALPARMLRVLK